MHLTYDNLNEAFHGMVQGIHSGSIPTVRTTSRNGDVLQVPEAMTITYLKPKQRVLLNTARDANPFFHLYESLWMLAGRNDVAPLAFYAKNMLNYSDDGKTLNGSYGYRWRQHGTVWSEGSVAYDQLLVLINHLHNNPNSRRAVLSMWNVDDDLMQVETSKDVCCNLSACFSIRPTKYEQVEVSTSWNTEEKFVDGIGIDLVLDMTVFNRSNDLIWGTLGANAVHFSFLQEYLACCLGVGVGVYNQISNNAHVYVNNWYPEKWLSDTTPACDKQHFPLVENQQTFEVECQQFVEAFARHKSGESVFEEPFLEHVAKPMCLAFVAHKRRDYEEAGIQCAKVEAVDWQTAGCYWLAKRHSNWRAKQIKNTALQNQGGVGDSNVYLERAKRRGEVDE